MRLQTARYACENGTSTAALHFSKKLGQHVRSSTVPSIKAAYLEEIKKLRLMGKETSLNILPVNPLRPKSHYNGCDKKPI